MSTLPRQPSPSSHVEAPLLSDSDLNVHSQSSSSSSSSPPSPLHSSSSSPSSSLTLSSLLSSPVPLHFEALKKTARKLESQAYTKLSEWSRLSTSIQTLTSSLIASHSHSHSHHTHSAVSSAPIKAEAEVSAHLETEIGDLLHKLNETVEEMARCLQQQQDDNPSTGGTNINEAHAYNVQRYRAIVHDYTAEFHKTKELIVAAQQRAELLLPPLPSSDSANGGNSSSLRPRTDLLMREKQSLHTSLRMADDLIATASESRESLHAQSALFGMLRGRVSALRSKFPLVNSVMGRIERQRQKDVIVMAAVLTVCICFTLIYIANKP